MRTKIVLLLAVALLIASFAAGLKGQYGWKWHREAAGVGFTWDPSAAGFSWDARAQ